MDFTQLIFYPLICWKCVTSNIIYLIEFKHRSNVQFTEPRGKIFWLTFITDNWINLTTSQFYLFRYSSRACVRTHYRGGKAASRRLWVIFKGTPIRVWSVQSRRWHQQLKSPPDFLWFVLIWQVYVAIENTKIDFVLLVHTTPRILLMFYQRHLLQTERIIDWHTCSIRPCDIAQPIP